MLYTREIIWNLSIADIAGAEFADSKAGWWISRASHPGTLMLSQYLYPGWTNGYTYVYVYDIMSKTFQTLLLCSPEISYTLLIRGCFILFCLVMNIAHICGLEKLTFLLLHTYFYILFLTYFPSFPGTFVLPDSASSLDKMQPYLLPKVSFWWEKWSACSLPIMFDYDVLGCHLYILDRNGWLYPLQASY